MRRRLGRGRGPETEKFLDASALAIAIPSHQATRLEMWLGKPTLKRSYVNGISPVKQYKTWFLFYKPLIMPPSYREGLFQALFIVMSGFIRVLYAATLCNFPQTRVTNLYFSNRDLSRKT